MPVGQSRPIPVTLAQVWRKPITAERRSTVADPQGSITIVGALGQSANISGSSARSTNSASSESCLASASVRDVVEQKLQAMLQSNPQRMDYYRKYQEIIADYNREKDRVTVEETFVRLVQLAEELDAEQRRAVEEGLSEDELALFDLLGRENITKADRERLEQASRDLLKRLHELLRTMEQWTQNAQTQAEVERFILDHLYTTLPRPPFTEEETQEIAGRVYEFVWEQCAAGVFSPAA